MDHFEFANRLVDANDEGRLALLGQQKPFLDLPLAYALKDICYSAWGSEPDRTVRAANALTALARHLGHPEVQAVADWTNGIAAIITGQMESALKNLDQAAEQFEQLGQPHTAAATQVSKVMVLAILGQYDAALASGLKARDVFLAHDDLLAAGKIEQNLGNLHVRRDRYADAEKLYLAARERFEQVGDATQLMQIEVCLAVALAAQHRFREAAQLYATALAQAEAARQAVTQAEIECNLGCLALFQGQYDVALEYLERSRRRYVSLDMPHETAVAELELADAYLELNLAPEASEIYTRIAPIFGRLGLQAEQARTLAHHGRAYLLLGQAEQAQKVLAEARKLYLSEGNEVGEAVVTLTEAQLHHLTGDYEAVVAAAGHAEVPLLRAGTWGRYLLVRWLQGEAVRSLGQTAAAQDILRTTLQQAEQQMTPQIAQRCHTSLGMLAAEAGNLAEAEASFKQAVALIEELRAPLPAEEFRTAFIADKLTAYNELVRLCLNDDRPERIVEALGYVERARSRALLDMLGGAFKGRLNATDPFEADLLARLETLREELNWYYSQINRPSDDTSSRGPQAMVAMHEAVRERETAVLQITRQLQQLGKSSLIQVEPLDLDFLQDKLAEDSVLVEYFSLDGELFAFVVTNDRVDVVRQLGGEADVQAALNQLRFQLNAMRYGSTRLNKHLGQLTSRTRYYLGVLYDLLLRPLAPKLDKKRLIIVPHRVLHYVPFHALYDGSGYVMERQEVVYAPSASVLHHCFAKPTRQWQRALILGVPEVNIPYVQEEVTSLASLFQESTSLIGEEANLAALRTQAPYADLIHLACHGQFRPDNPLFSALRLSDSWLTVRDTYHLDLQQCGLVVLSACETGVGALAPGDDLIGLTRGFISAGAPSLIVSLWMVDDEITAQLMRTFYQRLLAGDNPAAALRFAQLELAKQHPHPFFWSPFVLLGRW
ncbi:MAG: CHAT domain-containing protein [Anaerolineaceae bacterium]|nr:CHAT domain-containing protein [Anaerolineaceae bacterium]